MAETLPNGTVIPQGEDLINSNGVQAMRNLGASVDSALAGKAGTDYVDAGLSGKASLAQLDTAKYAGGSITTANSGIDVFALTAGKVYSVGSATAAAGMLNMPEEWPGPIVVDGNPGSTIKTITFYPYNRSYYWRTITRNAAGAMQPWLRVDLEGASPGVWPQHAIRQAQMMTALDGPIDTGGRGAVAFRIDHGFANFKAKLLPLFQAAGIVPMITYNPRDWGRPENAGVTPAEVNGWVADGLVEISNHTATHSDATGTEAVYDAIVTSLAEIEAQLPAAAGQVWGFCVPGVGGTGFDGFGGGSTPEQWDTYAGRLILQHHAVGFGALSGTELRDLDGTIRDGLRHITMDSASVSALKSRVDQAVDQRRGAQFMVHPSLIDTEGYLTTAQFGQVLDYIVARRDAGELVALSSYQMLVADATIPAGVDVDAALAAYRAAIA